MGGVDYNNQLRKYYHFRLKSRKFYKYIFWFLVELCIVNAYIMCEDHTHLTKLDLKEFRSMLATELQCRTVDRLGYNVEMPVAYSEDLRWRAVWLCLYMEVRAEDTAKLLHISERSVYRYVKRFNSTGRVARDHRTFGPSCTTSPTFYWSHGSRVNNM